MARSRILASATQAPATWIQGQARIAIAATWAWEVLRARALAQIRQSDRGTEARTLQDQRAEAHPARGEVAADQERQINEGSSPSDTAKKSSPREKRLFPHNRPIRINPLARLPGGQPAPQEAWISPQLATLTDQAPVGDDWIHELKYDGYRIMARVENHAAQLLSRNNLDWTSRLQRIADAVAAVSVKTAWLDGEVVAIMLDGSLSFQALQNAFGTRSDTHLAYYVFDLVYLDGYDFRNVPLLHRKQALAELLQPKTDGLIRYSDHIVGGGPVVFDQACQQGMEGIMSKRRDAVYRSTRNRDWLKVKCTHRQEFVIGGFTDPGGIA